MDDQVPDVQPEVREEPSPDAEDGYRFDDAWWDDAFATLYDPAMRVCSAFGC